jgi:hypothetical protein
MPANQRFFNLATPDIPQRPVSAADKDVLAKVQKQNPFGSLSPHRDVTVRVLRAPRTSVEPLVTLELVIRENKPI